MKKMFFLVLFVLVVSGCGVASRPSQNTLQYNKDAYTPKITVSSEPTIPTSTPTSTLDINEPSMSTTTPAEQKTFVVTLHTTKGDIEITLNKDETPRTVENFVTLSKKGFYDNTIFHRAIAGFMIQGGDPTGTGTGGPGYEFDNEPFTGKYIRGTIAMANHGINTNGSQFFIMHADYPLPPNYTIFGHVSKGIEVVDAIATAPVEPSRSGENSKPITPVSIKSVSVEQK